ncbi:hypothetical protein EXVG_00047 [Emiliania huxleyi virus 202]|nr:hypothetical protein EXVG_00047 [Emiliania huxleyi virus 202]AHA54505.1 putative membrane protein [Emiliania huxleyi virus 18]AHA55545.1 putative membrane protein [Emiliania huxleyi virus 156]
MTIVIHPSAVHVVDKGFGPMLNLFGFVLIFSLINVFPIHTPLKSAQLTVQCILIYFAARFLFHLIDVMILKVILCNVCNLTYMCMSHHAFSIAYIKISPKVRISSVNTSKMITSMLMFITISFSVETSGTLTQYARLHTILSWCIYLWSGLTATNGKWLLIFSLNWGMFLIMESIKITDSKLNMAITINEIFCVIGNLCLANYVISKSVQEFVRNQ